jgi:hypothetical protein
VSAPAIRSLVPASIDPSSDEALAVREASQRILDAVALMDDVEMVVELNDQWRAFIGLVDGRRRRSTAQAEATSRRIEMRIGELTIGRTPPEELSDYELTTFRMFARWSDIVEQVIAESTNRSPASRNKCIEAIRWHRHQIGDLKSTSPRRRPVRTPRDEQRRLTAEAIHAAMSIAEGAGHRTDESKRMSLVYQRVRQALATLSASPIPADGTRIAAELEAALTTAERLTVQLIRLGRTEP